MESRSIVQAATAPVSTAGRVHPARSLDTEQQSAPLAPLRGGKLDLRGMPAPVKLAESRLEDLTIDGICGVY